jgi:hypothetical protein
LLHATTKAAAPRRLTGAPTHGYEPTREAVMAAFAKSPKPTTATSILPSLNVKTAR